MPCEHCCGADQFFDLKVARKKMKYYKRKGPGKATKKLLSLFSTQQIQEKSLLDIGGGIGAIQWYFLENGAKRTTDVDASNAYISVAKAHAEEKNLLDIMEFHGGDFLDKSSEISAHDFVTLDKVVCCYPDYQHLLGMALDKCNETIALTFPLGGLLSKILELMENLYFSFKKNPFRTFIHSPRAIEGFIVSSGFEPVEKRVSFPWHVQMHRRLKT
jgi:magnesium-protoporphyrin O-methyltransferase